MTQTAQRVFGMLVGDWLLHRRIEPGLGTATGRAVFAAVGAERLDYREDVRVHLSTGFSGDAYRQYTYLLETDRIRVLTADGNTLHVLAFEATDETPGGTADETGWAAVDIHTCRADRYRGTYRMDVGGVLSVDMEVLGPAKDYRILTRYERARSES